MKKKLFVVENLNFLSFLLALFLKIFGYGSYYMKLGFILKLEKFLKKDNRKIMKWVEDQNFELLNFKNKNYFFNINSKSDLTEAKKIERLLKKL